MKILVIHHLEKIWEPSYISIGGIDFEQLCSKVADYIDENDFDKVILTQFESHPMTMHFEYAPLMNKVTVQHEYGYGWELDCFDFEPSEHEEVLSKLEEGLVLISPHGVKLALGGSHSQVVLIEDWIEDLIGHDVHLCGAFDGECIEDISLAMSAVNVNYKRVESLII